jgi:uncharacterized protein YndB with AHSA1/START domain
MNALSPTLVPVRVETGRDSRRTLVFEREFSHPPQALWTALTTPDGFAAWGPFRPDRPLTSVGPARLEMADGNHHGSDREQDCTVEVVEEPTLLQHRWGSDVLRWELRKTDTGTRLTLRHTTANAPMLSSFAAGWHSCTDFLAAHLDGSPAPAGEGDVGDRPEFQALEAAYRDVLEKP